MNKSRNTVLGLVLIGIIAAAFLLPRLLGGDDENGADNTTVGSDNVAEAPVSDDNVHLGNVVVAAQVDRDGCAVQTDTSLPADEPFYVVAENSDIPAGTSVFVRLYHENEPVEDAPEIQADQDYFNTCVNFVFEPDGQPFESGTYEAEFVVNGNQSDLVAFEVQ